MIRMLILMAASSKGVQKGLYSSPPNCSVRDILSIVDTRTQQHFRFVDSGGLQCVQQLISSCCSRNKFSTRPCYCAELRLGQ
jgi:hypothetical protein